MDMVRALLFLASNIEERINTFRKNSRGDLKKNLGHPAIFNSVYQGCAYFIRIPKRYICMTK